MWIYFAIDNLPFITQSPLKKKEKKRIRIASVADPVQRLKP